MLCAAPARWGPGSELEDPVGAGLLALREAVELGGGVELDEVLAALRVAGGEEVREEALDRAEDEDVADGRERDEEDDDEGDGRGDVLEGAAEDADVAGDEGLAGEGAADERPAEGDVVREEPTPVGVEPGQETGGSASL